MSNLILVIDFEATCDSGSDFDRKQSEIIEIGAVIANKQTGEIIDEFQSFIRPVINPVLTEFCLDLTTISQEDVDNADEFIEVYNKFMAWLGQHDVSEWGSWGNYDKNIWQRHLVWHNKYLTGAFKKHHNLKDKFRESYGLKLSVGLGKALFHANLRFDGTPHRGIDDALNIVRLLPKINFEA